MTPTKAANTTREENKPQPQIPDDFRSFNPNLNLEYDEPRLKTDFSKKVFDANHLSQVDFSRTDLPSFL